MSASASASGETPSATASAPSVEIPVAWTHAGPEAAWAANFLRLPHSSYIQSFIQIRDAGIREYVDRELRAGLLWPEPMIQLNPSFEPGCTIDTLVNERVLHPECAKIFRVGKDKDPVGKPLRLHKHQEEAIRAAVKGANYVLTTGTGSGKSLAYLVPIVDHAAKDENELLVTDITSLEVETYFFCLRVLFRVADP